MSKIPLIARIIFGLAFVVFGLNGFLGFIQPPPPSPEGGAFLGALAATGYFFPFLKLTEIIGGALVLSGFYVPLALTVMAPVTINIFLYHAFLDPSPQGLGLPVILLVINAFLAYQHRDAFRSVLKAK